MPPVQEDHREEEDWVSLASLPPGAESLIAAVESESAVGRRLADLGFVAGTPIRVVRRAPLGDPSLYELRGYRLCLRRSEAARVLVRPLPRPAR